MSPAASDSGNEAATKTKKKSSTKSKKEEVEEVQDSENNSDAGDEDEEEYEIEAILEAKKGRFPEVIRLSSPRDASETHIGGSRANWAISSSGKATRTNTTAGSSRRTLRT
jgi:hypothetical protein